MAGASAGIVRTDLQAIYEFKLGACLGAQPAEMGTDRVTVMGRGERRPSRPSSQLTTLEPDMKSHLFLAAAALTLGLSTFAQAGPNISSGSGLVTDRPAKSGWSEPARVAAADKPAAPLYDPAENNGPVANSVPPTSELVARTRDLPPNTASVNPEPAPRKPVGYRTARYSGGEGSTWKSGRNIHNFMGSYGGCSYRGFAGPNGYKIDRSC